MIMNTTTRDIALAAYLKAIGFSLADWVRTNGTTTFTFEPKDGLMEAVESYYNDQATISPLRYSQAMRTLKNLIHLTTNAHNKDKSPMYHNQESN